MKKWIWAIIGGAVLAAGGVTFAIVLSQTKNVKATSFEFEGTWQAFELGQSDQGAEYFVFKGNQVTNYKNGEVKRQTEFSTSELNNTMTKGSLTFKGWGKDYTFDRDPSSLSVFGAYRSDVEGFVFCRVKEKDYIQHTKYTAENLTGIKYDVILHGGKTQTYRETLEFHEGNTVTFCREGKPYLGFDHVAYSVNDYNIMDVPGIRFYLSFQDDTYLRMAEFSTDSLTGEKVFRFWELKKA